MQEALFTQYVIMRLSSVGIRHERMEDDYVSVEVQRTPTSVDEGIKIDQLRKLNHKNISAWDMSRWINMVGNGSLATLDEQLEGMSVRITSEKEAKKATKRIFRNLIRPGSRAIYLEDLMRFLIDDDALKTLVPTTHT